MYGLNIESKIFLKISVQNKTDGVAGGWSGRRGLPAGAETVAPGANVMWRWMIL
jgi:hypothetical protein